jgi:hypothetical protein
MKFTNEAKLGQFLLMFSLLAKIARVNSQNETANIRRYKMLRITSNNQLKSSPKWLRELIKIEWDGSRCLALKGYFK